MSLTQWKDEHNIASRILRQKAILFIFTIDLTKAWYLQKFQRIHKYGMNTYTTLMNPAHINILCTGFIRHITLYKLSFPSYIGMIWVAIVTDPVCRQGQYQPGYSLVQAYRNCRTFCCEANPRFDGTEDVLVCKDNKGCNPHRSQK